MADSGTEESSWTFYIQGFMCDDAQNSSSSSDDETPSLVSDASSSAVKKSTDIHSTDTKLRFPNGIRGNNHDNDNNMMGKNISIMCKQNSFKKQKTKVPASLMDYDLEDTASSPANSPKAKRNVFGKGGALNDHHHVEKESNSTDLKKRTCDY
ncbi:uncharacterized protein LOC142518807 isoform X2 [Primulina tabacum]|uniref:uncharacterized protein LOC142518807 isoform X2 n=1 Tax=Primulina tabacum TaxID=48773 RepID=UPI003F59AB0B